MAVEGEDDSEAGDGSDEADEVDEVDDGATLMKSVADLGVDAASPSLMLMHAA